MPTGLGLIATKQELLQVSQSGYCTILGFVLPPRNTPSPCRVLILAAFLLTAYKTSPGKPQAFGDEVPFKYGWHPTVHLLQDLQAASLNSQHLAAHKTSQFKASHAEMPRKPLLGKRWVLLWLCHWESSSDSLFQQFTSSAVCHWDLGPGIWLGSHRRTTRPQKEGDLRELCCRKESSIPHWYFLSQIHPFRMNCWTLATFFMETS